MAPNIRTQNLPRPQDATPQAILDALNALIDILEKGLRMPAYSMAQKPPAASVPPGTVIYVYDEAVGQVFQGADISTGAAAWVFLG